jgi:integrase
MEMSAGRFDYARWFPAGNKLSKTPPRQGWTVREYYGKWILQQRPPLHRKAQERDYRQHFGRHILPRFGEVMLSEETLTTRALIDFQNYLLHDVPRRKKGLKGLAVKTVRNIIDSSFRAMVRDAREIDHIIAADPFEAIQWPDNETRRRDPFSKEDRDKIIEYFREKKPFYYPFVFAMFWTGMRPSEATALRVGDVDLKNATASVIKSRYLDDEKATKTKGSRRTVKLLPNVVAVLSRAKELRVSEDDYFFKNRKRRPINADNWREDYWYQALRAKDIRERNFYNTRHTFISLALTAGENIKAIAEQCGTSVQMIEKHYGRYMSSDFGQRLMADLKAETEIKTEMEAAGQKGEGTEVSETAVNSDVTGKRPRRDLNPCCRRERPVSWARLDDRDVMVSRAGFEPATLCLKGRCSTA